MLATAKNYDGICFELKNSLYSQLDNPLKTDLTYLSKNVKGILSSGNKIEHLSVEMLGQVFDLRVKALKWLTSNVEFDHSDIFRDIFQQVEVFKSNTKLEVLVENILFALRCNQRVVESLIQDMDPLSLESGFGTIPEITYGQYVTALALGIPDDEKAQQFMSLTNASLHIEFILLAADIINSENLDISEKTVQELAFLMADSAQEYSAIATELGLLKRPARHSSTNLSFDPEYIKEQKELADLGLTDFGANLLNG